jgi:hypothetical protein
MSAFLADLTLATIMNRKNELDIKEYKGSKGDPEAVAFRISGKLVFRKLEQMRISARLPFEITWVEYSRLPYRKRYNELHGISPPPGPNDNVIKEGWLLVDSFPIIQCFSFCFFPNEIMPLPYSYLWSVDDTIFKTDYTDDVDHEGRTPAGRLLGLTNANYPFNEKVNIERSKFASFDVNDPSASWSFFLERWRGPLRRIWAFLATLDDIPVLRKEVTTSKGFISGHTHKPYLDHHTITLSVPQKEDFRKIARNVIAKVRRRAHPVRGHWREDFRNSPKCPRNWINVRTCEYTTEQICKKCGGHRIWVNDYETKGREVGIDFTDYTITH